MVKHIWCALFFCQRRPRVEQTRKYYRNTKSRKNRKVSKVSTNLAYEYRYKTKRFHGAAEEYDRQPIRSCCTKVQIIAEYVSEKQQTWSSCRAQSTDDYRRFRCKNEYTSMKKTATVQGHSWMDDTTRAQQRAAQLLFQVILPPPFPWRWCGCPLPLFAYWS